MNYMQHLQLLAYERDYVKFVNDPLVTLRFLDKASIFNFPHLIPETIVTKSSDLVEQFLIGRGKIVVKPLNGFSGNDVRIYEGGGIEIDEFVMVQEYLENVKDGDTRVHICDGDIIGAIKRVPSNNDFRGNLHAGGTGVVAHLSESEIALSKEVGEWLSSEGVFLAGIDLIDGKLTEINITSPGIIIETNELMNTKLEAEIFDRLERNV
jgi:glutathione synthase